MGSCASARRNSGSSGKFRGSLVHSETDKHPDSMPSTPVKEKLANVVVVDQSINSHVYGSQVSPLNSVASYSNNGSKEEAFFDSQAWLESDCDDDFYSVKGDFTPSRGSTPLYRSIAGTPLSRTLSPQVNGALFGGRAPSYNEPNQSSHGSTPLHRSVSATSPQVDLKGVSQKLSGSTTNTPPREEKKKRKKLADLFRESISENREDESDVKMEASLQKSTNATPHVSGTNPQCSSGKRASKHLKSAHCCFPRLPSARGFKKTFAAAPTIAVDA